MKIVRPHTACRSGFRGSPVVVPAGAPAFTLVEMLVVISIATILFAMILPALGLARRSWRQTQGGTQLRGIHGAIVARAASNNGAYVGLARDGYSVVDATAAGRFKTLLDEKLVPPIYLISPIEDKKPWTSGPLLPQHYSFSMLSITLPGARRDEWRGGTSSAAPVLSDRAIDNGLAAVRSVHRWPAQGTEEWIGSVCWNDSHVTWELTRYLPTTFKSYEFENDNLFLGATPNDALLVYESE